MTARGNILIVEDDPDLADNLVEILEGLGWTAASVASAEAALELLRVRAFDGVVTDFRLPGLSGAELIDKLRAMAIGVPVVVVSALMDEAARERARLLGALAVLGKPIDLERLFALLESFVEPCPSVLIVDDNEALADNLAEAFRQEGLTAIVGSTGSAALGSDARVRVALVDVRLPDLSGVEVARRLHRRDPRIKVVFVTAYPGDLDAGRGEQLGEVLLDPARPYLIKPFDVGKLVREVKKAAEQA
jgi:CheY-like chemotaxis protein